MNLRLPMLCLLIACLSASAWAEGPPLKNGVSLHGPLTWGRTDDAHTTYLSPVYEGDRYAVPMALLNQVKQAGFDFVRLSVDPGPLLALSDKAHEALEQHVIEVVQQIRSAGLDVLVDFHPIRLVAAYAPGHLESDLFPAYVEMIRRSAHMLAPFGVEHIAIEPMNEPQLGYNSFQVARWQRMMEQLYQAVHVEMPQMTVILTGGRGGSIEGLLNLDPVPFAGGNVRYSFHYYLPFPFTHQGVKGTGGHARVWPFTVGLPYPAKPEALDAFMAEFGRRVDQSTPSAREKKEILADGQRQMEAYFHGQGTRDAIAADFGRVSAWAKEHGVAPEQIFLGEFGATQKSPGNDGANPDDRARWLTDVRQEAEARGFGWSLWVLNGPATSGMTLVSVTDPSKLDAATLKALGKTADTAPRRESR